MISFVCYIYICREWFTKTRKQLTLYNILNYIIANHLQMQYLNIIKCVSFIKKYEIKKISSASVEYSIILDDLTFEKL